MNSNTWYALFTKRFAKITGKSSTFTLAIVVILVWLVSGPFFDFSNTWQLIINTATTIITFVMVFVIQNTQNRDTEAMHVKLDELIRATQGAHNALLDLEELEEDQIDQFRKRYEQLANDARQKLALGESDMDIPDSDEKR